MARGLLDDLLGDLYTALTGAPRPDSLALGYENVKEQVVHAAAQHPIDAMVACSLAGTALLYLAERDANPKLQSVPDAFWAVTSCLAAVSDAGGAVTPAGKVLLGWIMAIGPVLQSLGAAEAVVQRHAPPPAPALDPVIVARLEHIVELLEGLTAKQLPPRSPS